MLFGVTLPESVLVMSFWCDFTRLCFAADRLLAIMPPVLMSMQLTDCSNIFWENMRLFPAGDMLCFTMCWFLIWRMNTMELWMHTEWIKQ